MDFFKGIRFYLKDKETGLLAMKFVCDKCGKEMEEADGGFIPCTMSGAPLIHQAKFYCKDCYDGGKYNGKTR